MVLNTSSPLRLLHLKKFHLSLICVPGSFVFALTVLLKEPVRDQKQGGAVFRAAAGGWAGDGYIQQQE
jgi:hypothetical protein